MQAGAPPGPAPPDWKGTARFEVLREIGRGGMGVVYEARDREEHRRVALKTLAHFDPASLYLFKQEFRTLAGVIHPNLVRLYELVASGDERVFFSMELVRGVDFETHVTVSAAPRIAHERSNATSPETVEALRSSSRPVSASGSSETTGSTRGTTPADLDRLRPALRQLVEGVHALHLAGKLHRDIKPSNVLVTHEGRVVLLDFGVATELRRAADAASHDGGQMVGTARYMAPEQAFDDPPSSAADWYSVGVMLYEALTGAPPFQGPAVDVIAMKYAVDPRPPSEWVEGVPADLDALCRALLDRVPDRRPSGAEILRRLGVAPVSPRGPTAPAEILTSLVGRESQMRALSDAFRAAQAGRCTTLRVNGPAGMGKSVLVERFLDGLVDGSDAVVLRGRAYERESVPYKAIDSVIDALSRHLMHLMDSESTFSLPRDMSVLARLFPVLRRVPAIAELEEQPVVDPQQARRRAFEALRQLLAALTRRKPLVLYVDDAQWGDADSALLLLEVVRPPYAPPILLLLAHRDEEVRTVPFLAELKARWPAGAESDELVVGPLDPEHARELAVALLPPDERADPHIVDALVRESSGSPFLVDELARSATGRLRAPGGARVTLGEVVSDRLANIPDDARRLLEVIAVGGRPLALSSIGSAAGIESIDDAVAYLAEQRFVRQGLRDGREMVEPIHDRIRETIVASLPEARVRHHHRRLAEVLEASPTADPDAVALHWFGAGEAERGARFAERAGEHAAFLLAFDEAARWLRLTIVNLPSSSRRLGRLRARLAEVLGWAGRSDAAGRAYLEAAEMASGAERLGLERAAAAHLLAAGRIDEGGVVLRRVLETSGVDVPRSPGAAILRVIGYKLRLKVLGLRFEERDSATVRPEDRARIEAVHVASLGLTSVDNVLAACMQALELIEALRAGDRAQVLRAAVIYRNHLACRGGPIEKHEQDVEAIVQRLIPRTDDVEAVALARGVGGVSLFLRGRWREALATLDAAYEGLVSQRAGVQAQGALYAVYSLAFLGDLVELRRRQLRLLADAEQRGDLFLSVQLRASHPVVLVLAADDPDGARRQTREAKAQWTQSQFLIQHWQIMRSEAEIELYSGEGVAAYERLAQDERALAASRLLTVQFMRALTLFARARAAIASIAGAPATQAARLAEAHKIAARLRQEKMAWTAPLAAMVEASLENASGDRPAAIATLRRAVALAEAADMSLYAAAARHQLGAAVGGDEGSLLLAHAVTAMTAQEIRSPERFATMLVPGRWAPPAR